MVDICLKRVYGLFSDGLEDFCDSINYADDVYAIILK